MERIFDLVCDSTNNTQEGYYIFGHSAGSQFVHRMLLFSSEMHAALAIAANAGSYTMPTVAIDYPDALQGSPIDDQKLVERLNRPLVVLLGSEDTDPDDSSLPRRTGAMAQGPHRVARGELFFRTAQQQTERLQQRFRWTLQPVPRVGHHNSRMAPPQPA